MVCRHGRRGLPEHRHHRELRPEIHGDPGGRPHLQDGLRTDAAAACRFRRRRHHRLPRGAAHGGHRLRRDGTSTTKDRITAFVEKPKDPPGIPGNPDMALASMGIYVFETEVPGRASAPRCRRPEFQPRLRQGHHPLHRQATARPWRTASPTPACARPRRPRPIGATSERSMPIGRPTSTSPTRCPQLDLYDQNWPIWTYAEVTPPAKFVHDVEGRRGTAVSSLVSGDCIVSGASIKRSHALHQCAGEFLLRRSKRRWCCPTCNIGRNARLKKVVIDTRRRHSRRPRRRRGSGTRCQALPPHRQRHLPHHPAA